MGSDWLGTDFGMNRNKSDWFGMNFNQKLLPGYERWRHGFGENSRCILQISEKFMKFCENLKSGPIIVFQKYC